MSVFTIDGVPICIRRRRTTRGAPESTGDRLDSVAVDFTSCGAVGADAGGGGRSILWLPMARQRRRETSEQTPPACEVAKKAVGGRRRGSPGVSELQGASGGARGRRRASVEWEHQRAPGSVVGVRGAVVAGVRQGTRGGRC